jgi:ketosteroid isomerase-like protein
VWFNWVELRVSGRRSKTEDMTKSGALSETDRDTASIGQTYFEAWLAKDWDTLRSILADDVTFHGPLASIDNADDCVAGLRGMSEIMTDIVIKKVFVSGDDVLTWFDLHTKVADPTPTANWSHVENGKITAINVTFDARKLAP